MALMLDARQNRLMTDETIGARIRALREALGLSRDQLGAQMGISPTAVYKVESGRVKWPTRAVLDKYAGALRDAMPPGVEPVEYLVYGIEPVAPKEAPLSEWAIDHDPNLDDEARAYLRHALGYVKRTQRGSTGDMSAQ